MNDPIISPFLIYLIDTVEPLIIVLTVSAIVSIIMFILFLTANATTYDDDKVEENSKKAKLFLKVGVTCGLLWVFIPRPCTLYKMVVANYITPANIQATGEFADKTVDKVIDKITNAIQKFERGEKK